MDEIFPLCPVERDTIHPVSQEAHIPETYGKMKVDTWIRSLQPTCDSLSGIFIREEYLEALEAVIEFWMGKPTSDEVDVDASATSDGTEDMDMESGA